MSIEAVPALGLMPGFPYEVWEAVAEGVRPTFADSYLAKAVVLDRVIWPHTRIAYDRLSEEPEALKAILACGYALGKTAPYGEPPIGRGRESPIPPHFEGA